MNQDVSTLPLLWQAEVEAGTEFGQRILRSLSKARPDRPRPARPAAVELELWNRPGDALHELLRNKGVKVAHCKCQEWIDRMNLWGPSGCRDNIDAIVTHLYEEASTSDQVSILIRVALRVPVIGVMEGRRRLRQIVMEAIDMAETVPHRGMTAEEIGIRLQSPTRWPRGWRDWPNVIEFHKQLLQEAIHKAKGMSLPQRQPDSKAIIIPAGGRCYFYDKNSPQFYFWNAFAAAWVLRARGCQLPIEFWFLPGEMEEVEHCELFARRVAATCHTVDTSGMRVVGGWQIKINAILQSEYQNIIYMDADNIAAADPTYLFDSEEFRKNDILLWSDNPRIDDYHGFITAHQWARVGLDRTDKALDVETGQMVVNKHRAWKALHIIKHFADRADYWEGFNGGETGVWYGDKTSFHMGCILAGIDFHIEKWNKFDGGGFFAHTGLNGSVLFQHACHRKGHLTNGHTIQNLKGNEYVHEAAVFKSPLVFLDGTVEDAIKLIQPERHFDIGPDVQEREVWMDVVSRNEYQLPPMFNDKDVILDIGANSGAFSYACLRRGAGSVMAFEPGPVYTRCENNCAEFGDRVQVINAAVWRSDQPVDTATLHPHGPVARTPGYSITLAPTSSQSWTVTTLPLDQILISLGEVHLMKLDCEGSEFPILFTSKELRRCEYIIGEYHQDADPALGGPEPVGGWPEWSMRSLQDRLESNGFEVYQVTPGSSVHGGFWARRLN